MDIKIIKGNAAIVYAIVEQWENTGELDELERQVLTNKLQELVTAVQEIEPEEVEEEYIDDGFPQFSVEIEPEKPVVAEKPVKEEPTPTVSDGWVAVDDEQKVESEPEEEEELEVTVRRGRVDRKKIRSLYEDDDSVIVDNSKPEKSKPTKETKAKPAKEEKPKKEKAKKEEKQREPIILAEEIIENEPPAPKTKSVGIEQKTVLGDVMKQGLQVLGDTISTTGGDLASRITSDRKAGLGRMIGVNDKYLFISELFGGSKEAYDVAIERLDGFVNFDDAMVWIYDNYNWAPDNRAAQLLVELLTRKLS